MALLLLELILILILMQVLIQMLKYYIYINKSSVELAVKSAEKPLKKKFTKELLSYMSSISKPLKYVKYFI